MSDPTSDPFGERVRGARSWSCRLLGARFVFETTGSAVERLIRRAFAGLPSYRMKPRVPTLRVRVVVRRRESRYREAPPAPRFTGGAGIVTAVIDDGNYAVLAPRHGSALLVLTSDMLQHSYHLRYELLEFVVITMAVRSLGLIPLHAACLALGPRAVMLVGGSGSGKSTLSLNGAAGGLRLVSEDNLFVEPRGLHAAALPNYIYVRRDLPARLLPPIIVPALARAETIQRRSGIRKRALDLRGGRIAVASRAVRIEAIVLLTARRGQGDLLRPSSAATAIARLHATQRYAAHQPGWRRFVRGIARLPCFELRRGATPAAAVAALGGLLGTQARSARR